MVWRTYRGMLGKVEGGNKRQKVAQWEVSQFLHFTKYYYRYRVQEHDIDGTLALEGDIRNPWKILVEDHLPDLGIGRNMIFKWLLEEIVCDGAGWIHWLRRVFIGGNLCRTVNETFWFSNIGDSWTCDSINFSRRTLRHTGNSRTCSVRTNTESLSSYFIT
jgi:hypothetical protein